MTYQVVRPDDQVDAVLNAAAEHTDRGSKYPGASFEEGITAAIEWLLGFSDHDPMADD